MRLVAQSFCYHLKFFKPFFHCFKVIGKYCYTIWTCKTIYSFILSLAPNPQLFKTPSFNSLIIFSEHSWTGLAIAHLLLLLPFWSQEILTSPPLMQLLTLSLIYEILCLIVHSELFCPYLKPLRKYLSNIQKFLYNY